VINYQTISTGEYIKVKWHKKELGRVYKENGKWHYRPRGCEGKIRSEEFSSLAALKQHIEGEKE
jgi:hypothetical protein